MSNRFDLDRLFNRYPDWPLMREAARNWQRELARNQAGATSLTGAFYWVPIPIETGEVIWEVQEFFDGWLPSSDHAYVWQHVRDSLELYWNRDLRSVGYCGLPRGRVCRSWVRGVDRYWQTHFVIYHGSDGPQGFDRFNLVRQKFNLDIFCRDVWDAHERMLPADIASLSRKLGIDLKKAIRGSKPFTARIFHA